MPARGIPPAGSPRVPCCGSCLGGHDGGPGHPVASVRLWRKGAGSRAVPVYPDPHRGHGATSEAGVCPGAPYPGRWVPTTPTGPLVPTPSKEQPSPGHGFSDAGCPELCLTDTLSPQFTPGAQSCASLPCSHPTSPLNHAAHETHYLPLQRRKPNGKAWSSRLRAALSRAERGPKGRGGGGRGPGLVWLLCVSKVRRPLCLTWG